ncbi:o-succinylbenzoate synthase, partial [Halorubrum tibetense]
MRLRRFSVALSSPLGTARGDIREREGFLVGVESGVGEATPLPGWTESLAACESARDAARTG